MGSLKKLSLARADGLRCEQQGWNKWGEVRQKEDMKARQQELGVSSIKTGISSRLLSTERAEFEPKVGGSSR